MSAKVRIKLLKAKTQAGNLLFPACVYSVFPLYNKVCYSASV
ncbi:hypothetical protein BACCOPRO_03510 [Phocaeicola coprophilus DSM 18228 = JCM 13818]|uniref:Uncharacterized protein n=1 Tax=Phocaeicola coprophilus DSM 18228 = JCM 13818 TaxID=547042 RepID=S0FDI3_9BACT|nr:hypothetical protein BACCOPRO_03510 [Phocaeicola coprophilus DSM 18228 = JCM 13818]